ncbi:hypothetical protein Q7M76_04500 [Candidatus Liberibacter asiaticus]|uniref:Uncharacterized protein n=1 Tax=Candidatus Liberibacter asiaticus str. gxpsy TaxID=1174529 RepID=A0ABN4B372_LIBAS|nr:hypothetical protein [Candidatus Liberibacter asiaticus]BAP26784.1 hypothetical protein CGUJ_04585 [Candidatus Liberibacter asiaticus str. Ishi-1]AGH17254.1 hypothetical protein WSI_04420 [Candidatus Liberibacter asiaticus str. gxpsy]ALK07548.1 hypothetical protein CD16_04495 [Candidatus Liberibacter asiaticus]ASK53041.1 hypothetical protein B2I23_04560 [Candidatus Liberibacter asiaticus]AWL14365.1 hypothetical protein DIC79_04585 [Candidatus Liberibacter asiaticus]
MLRGKYDISFLSLFLKTIKILGKLIFRHSAFTVIIVGYVFIFLWILSNALWNQTGKHPSPIFTTRHPQSYRIFLGSGSEVSKDKGITFKVEKVGDQHNKILLKEYSSDNNNNKKL